MKQGKKEKNTQAKAIAIIALILLSSLMQAAAMTVSHGTSPRSIFTGLKEFAMADHQEFTKIIAYFAIIGSMMEGISEDLSNNLRMYVVTNPSTTTTEVMSAMGIFITSVQAVYVAAMAATGLYMIFSSSSPKKRAQSKYLLGKMALGFILVSISPYILQLFLNLSGSMTEYIIDQSDPEIAANQYSELLIKTWQGAVAVVTPQIAVEWWPIHRGKHGVLGSVEDAARASGGEHAVHALHSKTWFQFLEGFKFTPKPDFSFPFLMINMFFIFMLYGMLAMRYIMVMTWALLFPVTIFFMTFEPTKGLGRNMFEQIVFWTILQVFYALSIDVIAAGFSAIPTDYDYFGIGLNLYILDITISFFTIGACIVLALTPLFTLSLFQRLTAP